MEIEELAKGLGCSVQPTGCLGACSQAPTAVIVQRNGPEVLHTRLDTVEKSAVTVAKATGRMPKIDDPALRQRLAAARAMRVRQQAREEKKWNAALHGLAEQVANTANMENRMELKFELAQLLQSAGQWELALKHQIGVRTVFNHPQVLMNIGDLLGKLGRHEEVDALIAEVEQMFSAPGCARVREQLTGHLRCCRGKPEHPLHIEGYAQWTLSAITPVSVHSAIFRFTSNDRSRGTPYTRGRGRTMWHKTWHTTLLAEVGPNSEGPLPWVERDYTPVSTWMDWERGECEIAIKIYPDGLATGWLHKQPVGCRVWLSQPHKTMVVPSLVLDVTSSVPRAALQHSAVLLVLGGTGVVAAAQVLQHTDPATCFGTAVRRSPPLTSPISLIYACRRDDVLMAGDLAQWCGAEAGRARLRRCVLAISPPAQDVVGAAAPFAACAPAPELMTLAALPNVSLVEQRVSPDLLQTELRLLPGPCRVVVSGPESFNGSVKEMLAQSGMDMDAVTILSA